MTHNRIYEIRQTNDICQSWPIENYDGGLTADLLSQRHRKEHRVINSSPPELDLKTNSTARPNLSSTQRYQSIRVRTLDSSPEVEHLSNNFYQWRDVWLTAFREKNERWREPIGINWGRNEETIRIKKIWKFFQIKRIFLFFALSWGEYSLHYLTIPAVQSITNYIIEQNIELNKCNV